MQPGLRAVNHLRNYSNGTLTAKATITVVANNATKKQLPTDTIVQYGRIESYTEIDKEIKADST